MALVGSSDRGALRSAIEGLLRTCAELEPRFAETSRYTSDQVDGIARELANLKLPGMSNLANDIAGIGKQMNNELTTSLADARRPYLEEAHQLLGLLAPFHGITAALPPLTVSAPNQASIAEHFPRGFAQDYVGDILGSIRTSLTMNTAEATNAAHVTTEAEHAAINATAPGFSEERRELGLEMLSDPECHMFRRHGSHIPDDAQLARLIWRKDFTGEYAWQLTPDGTVISDHNSGIVAGGFTSPEAAAKPIDAFLRYALERHDSWDSLLNNNTKSRAKVVGVHVDATFSGMTAEDVSEYRGAATGSRESKADWLAAREHAMDNGEPTVFAVPYNPIAEGDDPGALLMFRRMADGWHLTTCYSVDTQRPHTKRLEDLT